MKDATESNARESAGTRHAVVIGGSMAGLLAARILCEHFDRVTILERDRYPEGPEPRKGVPQSRHLHVLLMRGQEILEDLFPGIRDELCRSGATRVDAAAELAWLTPAGWGAPFRSGLAKLTFTRDLLDWHVRRRLGAFPQVGVRAGVEATGLLVDPEGASVVGVAVRDRSGEAGADDGAEQIPTDLVVDASGRGSRAPRWLTEIGFPAPRETVVDARTGYASRLYRRPPGFRADWKGVFIQAAPPASNRAGVLFPVEGERWLVSVAGGNGEYPPADGPGFDAFVASLRSPVIREALRGAEPTSPICVHRGTANRVRHFERLRRRPERFVVLGDAACAFNPVYGQGMTVAALGALTLDRCLRTRRSKNLAGLAVRFQRMLARQNAAPWMFATAEDRRYPVAAAATPPTTATRIMHGYVDAVLDLSTRSTRVRRVLLEVFHMLRPPTALFGGVMLARVLARSLRTGLRRLFPHKRRLPSRSGTTRG